MSNDTTETFRIQGSKLDEDELLIDVHSIARRVAKPAIDDHPHEVCMANKCDSGNHTTNGDMNE